MMSVFSAAMVTFFIEDFLFCLQSIYPLPVSNTAVTLDVALTPFILLFHPFTKFILLRCSETRVLILLIVSYIYPYLYLIRYDDTLFTTTDSDDGLGISAGTLSRFGQVEEISSEFKILPEWHIAKNMGLGRNNPLLTRMDALKQPINLEMLIGDSIWHLISVHSYIIVGIAMNV